MASVKHKIAINKLLNILVNRFITTIVYRLLCITIFVLIAIAIYYFYALEQLTNTVKITHVQSLELTENVQKKKSTQPLSFINRINLPKPTIYATPEIGKKSVMSTGVNTDSTIIKKTSSKPQHKSEYKTKPITELTVNSATNQVYQQLVNHGDSTVELAWPNSPQQYKKVLRYFEQCLGVGFGVITTHVKGHSTENITYKEQHQLFVLSPIHSNSVSPWLRAVSGELTVTEKRLMLNYAGTASNIQAVRLFPTFFDQTLARYISAELQGHKLVSFLAYFNVVFKAGKLTLIIEKQQLNGSVLSSPWLMHQC